MVKIAKPLSMFEKKEGKNGNANGFSLVNESIVQFVNARPIKLSNEYN